MEMLGIASLFAILWMMFGLFVLDPIVHDAVGDDLTYPNCGGTRFPVCGWFTDAPVGKVIPVNGSQGCMMF
jgi:hypothetical protein